MREETIVRENLMTVKGYTPYCGSDSCRLRNPRTKWREDREQFYCNCGWTSIFPKSFIERYKIKWGLHHKAKK